MKQRKTNSTIDEQKVTCKTCGGRMIKAGFRISKKRGRTQKYQCNDCGSIELEMSEGEIKNRTITHGTEIDVNEEDGKIDDFFNFTKIVDTYADGSTTELIRDRSTSEILYDYIVNRMPENEFRAAKRELGKYTKIDKREDLAKVMVKLEELKASDE